MKRAVYHAHAIANVVIRARPAYRAVWLLVVLAAAAIGAGAPGEIGMP